MSKGFSLTDEQMKRFEEILSKKNIFSTHLTKQEAKYDAFKSLFGSERILTDLKTLLPLGFKEQALIECDSTNLMDSFIALTKFSIQSGYTPILVLFMNNYHSVKNKLIEEGVTSEVIIIDSVSKSISPVEEKDTLFFADSLGNLTHIQIKILKVLQKKTNHAIIFDSLSVLNYYHRDETIFRFTHSLTKLIRKHSLTGFYLSTNKNLSSKINQFFDEQVTLKKYL